MNDNDWFIADSAVSALFRFKAKDKLRKVYRNKKLHSTLRESALEFLGKMGNKKILEEAKDEYSVDMRKIVVRYATKWNFTDLLYYIALNDKNSDIVSQAVKGLIKNYNSKQLLELASKGIEFTQISDYFRKEKNKKALRHLYRERPNGRYSLLIDFIELEDDEGVKMALDSEREDLRNIAENYFENK